MSVTEILVLLVFAALAWLWFDSLKARELAMRTARNACSADGLMLLDDTVAIARMKPVRNEAGHITLERAYDFEYSDTGNNRLTGGIVLRGHQVVMVNIGSSDGATVYTLH
jgi:hypothetical protein